MSRRTPVSLEVHSLSQEVFAATGQLIVAGAAIVVLCLLAGCSAFRGRQEAAMPARLQTPPEATLVSAGPKTAEPRGDVDPSAIQREQVRARQAEVDTLLNEAMTPPPAALKPTSALGVADRAVGPLADTLTAIETSQQTVVENLRNAETAGFKAARTAVVDGASPLRQLDDMQGPLQATHRTLDVAVQGPGYLQIKVYTPEQPEGGVAVTRNGRLYMSRDGTLAVGQVDGYQLIPPIHLPAGVTQVTIGQDGTVAALSGDESSTPVVVGRISLVRFVDPTSLRPLGSGIYLETESSGPAVESSAGGAAGAIVQGHLEASNVDLVRERLRLRFLQTWRSSLMAAIDGEAVPAAAPTVRATRQ